MSRKRRGNWSGGGETKKRQAGIRSSVPGVAEYCYDSRPLVWEAPLIKQGQYLVNNRLNLSKFKQIDMSETFALSRP